MKIAITGSSGFIGSALVEALRGDGHDVLRLVRRSAGAGEQEWDPARRSLDPSALVDVDAVVNLAGVNLGDKRWTSAYREKILSSRTDATTTVSETVAALAADGRPRALLSASAVGYYGDTGDIAVDESGPPGTDFLAGVCQAWEGATGAAESAGVRVVHLRSGVVLSPRGGSLAKQLPLFRLGLGGRLGSGRQYWAWVSLTDHLSAIRFLLDSDDVSGPVNITGPVSATNAEVTRAIGHALHRPTLATVPGFALRLGLGGMAEPMILAGQRVVPRVLQAAGFTFRHPDIEAAMTAELEVDRG